MNTTYQWIQLTSLADTTTYLNPELHIIRINCWTFPFQSLLYWFCCCKLFQAATSINTRYTFAVIPGWFYGTILWWSQPQDKFKPRFHRFWIGCIGLSILLTAYLHFQFASSFVFHLSLFFSTLGFSTLGFSIFAGSTRTRSEGKKNIKLDSPRR